MAPARRYMAFISYSHVDQELVRRLYASLKSFRLPRDLARLVKQQDAKSPRLGALFWDKREKRGDLSVTNWLDSALSSSDWVVVLSSAGSANSHWVSWELERFRQHREGRVLALILGDASYLLQHFPNEEPLAADLDDGAEIVALKLIAAMLQLSFDDLLQRAEGHGKPLRSSLRRLGWRLRARFIAGI